MLSFLTLSMVVRYCDVPEILIQRFHQYAGHDESSVEPDSDSLIGFFQMFRPDGNGVDGLFDELEVGDELQQRLESLYSAAGDDRRPQGGRDAYFVIRNPISLDPQVASQLGEEWIAAMIDLASCVGAEEVVAGLNPIPAVRVLEGIPPKHPKADHEKSSLLKTFQNGVTTLVDQIDADPVAETLRPAYYFTACDAMLRDYLMWPLYARTTGLNDPFDSYFQLWKHGVKYRIFGEGQIDLYLPRILGPA